MDEHLAVDYRFNPKRTRAVVISGKSVRIVDTLSGVDIVRFNHAYDVYDATFNPDFSLLLVRGYSTFAHIWDVTWSVKLTDDELVRGAASQMLPGGQGKLTKDERFLLEPVLGEGFDSDVVSRWLTSASDEKEMSKVLRGWHEHRETSRRLAERYSSWRVDKIQTELATRRSDWVRALAGEYDASARDLFEQNDLEGAFASYQKCHDLLCLLVENLRTPEAFSDLTMCLINMGNALRAYGERDALYYFESALELFKTVARIMPIDDNTRKLSVALRNVIREIKSSDE